MAENKVSDKRGHFFNKEQKELKQKIMEDLLNSFFGNISHNQEIFADSQIVIDMVGSILIMFNREILVHTFVNLGITNLKNGFMDNLFKTLKQEVNEQIKNSIM